ncbi:MAG: alkane 1-monooxygenase [Pseudomonadota bacterium]
MIFVAETQAGERVEYRDTKRYLWALAFVPSMVPVGFYMAYLFGSQNPLWMLGPIIFIYLIIPAVDLIFGEDTNNPPEAVVNKLAEDRYYTRLLFCAVGLCYLSFAVSAWVYATQDLPIWAMGVVAVTAGMVSGGALTIGHELGHRTDRGAQFGAKLINGLSWYGHFTQEHNTGHHTHVATPEDSASSRLNESVYAFMFREIPHGIRRGWMVERNRLSRRGHGFWTWRNEVLQSYAISAAIAVTCLAAFGWIMVPFLIVHTIFSWQQLTLANYVEHYGLKRARRENGKYEPCQPKHSWNTNHIFSNLLLFHLQRHSDHHANPMRPYQALRNFDHLPRLPSGYPGCFGLALIPPLWFRVMNPKVMAWADGDISKVNTGP